MITVDEALDLVLSRARPLPARRMPLAESCGLVLAEDVASDADSPPYDKSIVDGYAIVAQDLRDGSARLTILEEVVAGAVPTARVTTGKATRIMTGAPIPLGADCVVMVERTTVAPSSDNTLGEVLINDAQMRPGRNILPRGSSLRAGDVVLRSGALLSPAAIGLLAEVGRAEVAVVPPPTVAILPTGNELVEAPQTPAAGQIRNSNGPLLAAAVRGAGARALELPIARDDRAELRAKIGRAMESDVVLLSGGVSAGVLDLVPAVLAELGAEEVFHKVRLKPGKPLWFGVAHRERRETLIFGLPGNPVSSFVCCELFVRPAIAQLSGRVGTELRRVAARLAEDYRQSGDRQVFVPAWYEDGAGQATVRPVAWHGSADLRGMASANALLALAAGDRMHRAGEMVEVRLLAIGPS